MYQEVEIESVLKASPYFSGLSDNARRALARVSGLTTHRKGDVLFLEGRKGNHMYLLVRGRVKLYRSDSEGNEVTLRMVNPGSAFAEVILFEQDRYPVTAECVADTALVALPRNEIHTLLGDAAFRRDFMAFLMRRLRHLAQRVQELSGANAEERLLGFLRREYGGAGTVHVDLSKKDVAAAVGIAPESLSRLIKRLANAGVLAWRGHELQWLK